MIQTVRGKIKEENIHNTLAHEHLVFGYPGLKGEEDNPYQEETAYENCILRMDMIKRHDVDLIVDPTPFECGRDPLFMKRISQDSDVNIVCATGFYKDEDDRLSILKGMSYTGDLGNDIVLLFIKETDKGIGNSRIKAGIIKTATSYKKITALEQLILESAAKVQYACGIPVYTHCDRGTMATEQCEILLANGADPHKTLIGHQTSNRDLDEIRAIMEKGFLVGFDQFGILSIPDIPNDEEKTENLLQLLKEGYEDHIVLSHDCIFDRMGYVSKSKPRWPDQIYTQIVPILKEKGVDEAVIRKLTRDNLLSIFR